MIAPHKPTARIQRYLRVKRLSDSSSVTKCIVSFQSPEKHYDSIMGLVKVYSLVPCNQPARYFRKNWFQLAAQPDFTRLALWDVPG
jgi:hypothetical protein